MRLWSIHPKFLDSKGLVALWRETLLAQKVLQGKTKGYQNHPQLNRFKKQISPLEYISSYLQLVCDEADCRDYNFNRSKILFSNNNSLMPISVTSGQISYEWQHLLRKLEVRAPDLYNHYKNLIDQELHPLFHKVDGQVEDWEIVHKSKQS